jgi:hypothetical protein
MNNVRNRNAAHVVSSSIACSFQQWIPTLYQLCSIWQLVVLVVSDFLSNKDSNFGVDGSYLMIITVKVLLLLALEVGRDCLLECPYIARTQKREVMFQWEW